MVSASYWELTVAVADEVSEGVTNLVWELGAVGVVEEGPPAAPARLRAFFPATRSARALETSVRAYLDGLRALGFAASGEPVVAELAEEDWAGAWRSHFRPFPVGRSLVVTPPWETPETNGRRVLIIEPGRAFGTGQHGSTRGCLEALERILARRRPRRVIDLGAGSGILAIAAARLGVDEVLAVDLDPDAVAATDANAARNGVADRVRAILGDVATLATPPAPLVVANLLTAAHRRLAARYGRYVSAGGGLVLGGILTAEADDVAAALEAHGFRRRRAVAVDGWTTLHFRRQPAGSGRAPLRDRG